MRKAKALTFDRALALHAAAQIRDHLSDELAPDSFFVAGSVRRFKDAVHDLDLVIATEDAPALVARLLLFPMIAEALCSGNAKASMILTSGLQVDIRFCRSDQLGSMMAHCTGPREHNIEMRQRAAQHGLKLNEYGLFRQGERVAGDSEESIYAALGLEWIMPQKRGESIRTPFKRAA